MALAPGEHVGPFEILSSLGAGGMGEVYRGRDPQLHRDVAIKVLPEAMRRDAMRLARFEREARVLAALSHPNIAAIHGLEQHDGINALVLELVEGETLAARIVREPIAVTDTLAIAGQVAAALDAAHEKGIVHRDLKPANIVITHTGLVKVLDFGLATIAAPGDARGEETRTVAPTHEGMVVGTPAYMSPEQARGLPVDKRTDIWAFGCVLFEMLTGRRLFDGDSAAQTLAFVLTNEMDWSALPSQTPFAVRALLRRCLEREPAKRLGDVAAIRFALEDVSASTDQLAATRSGEAANGSRNIRGRVAAAAAALLIVAVAIGFTAWKSKPTAAQSRSQHLHIALPPGQRLAGLKTTKPTLAMSPDDNYIAYVATTQEEDARQIYLYSMERGTFEPVPGSVGAHSPFFSPDEEWLGFFSRQNTLMKIPVKGGIAPAPVTDIANPVGASWTDDHRIVVASFGSVLQVLREEGGVPEALTRRKPGDTMHSWPHFLPGGKALLFNVDGTSTIAAQQIGAADRRDLTGTGQGILPQYSASGHVVYAQAGSLFAIPFDPTRLQMKGGAPTKVVSGVLHAMGVAHFSVSARGGLAYVPGEFQQRGSNLVRIRRSGTIERTFGAQRNYNQPRVAPDARRLVVDVIDGDPPLSQLWLYDLVANELNQFTYRTDRDNRHATWVESNRLVVQSNRTGTRQLFLHPVDGGVVEQLTDFAAQKDLEVFNYPVSFCGDALTFVRLVPNAEGWVLHMGNSSTGGRKEPLNFPMTADGAPSLSPDCRWLAYVSDESGRREVWMRAFSNLGKGQQISKGGGNEPVWNPDPNKRELFSRDGESMMAARINEQGSIEGKAERLFADSYAKTNGAWSRPNYDVFPDGSFLMLKPADQEQVVTRINVVLNWREELTRLARGN